MNISIALKMPRIVKVAKRRVIQRAASAHDVTESSSNAKSMRRTASLRALATINELEPAFVGELQTINEQETPSHSNDIECVDLTVESPAKNLPSSRTNDIESAIPSKRTLRVKKRCLRSASADSQHIKKKKKLSARALSVDTANTENDESVLPPMVRKPIIILNRMRAEEIDSYLNGVCVTANGNSRENDIVESESPSQDNLSAIAINISNDAGVVIGSPSANASPSPSSLSQVESSSVGDNANMVSNDASVDGSPSASVSSSPSSQSQFESSGVCASANNIPNDASVDIASPSASGSSSPSSLSQSESSGFGDSANNISNDAGVDDSSPSASTSSSQVEPLVFSHIEFVTADRRKTQLMFVHDVEHLYFYKYSTVSGSIYICRNHKQCKAKALIDSTGACMQYGSAGHTHPSVREQYENLKLKNAVRDMCANDDVIAQTNIKAMYDRQTVL